MLRNALLRYTSSPPAGGAVSLRLVSVAVPQAELPATFPSEGKAIQFAAGCLTVRALTCPRCAACTESFPLIPHAVVVSLPAAGVKGASPLQLFLFEFFFLRRKKNG